MRDLLEGVLISIWIPIDAALIRGRRLFEVQRLLEEIRCFRYFDWAELRISLHYLFLNIQLLPSKEFLDIEEFSEHDKNNSPVKISLTCLKSLRLNIAQNFVKLYFTDFKITTPTPMRCCSQQPVFQKYRKKCSVSVYYFQNCGWLITPS